MKKLLVIFCLIFSGFLGGQNADKWEQIYGGPGPDIGYSVKTCPDSGYIVAGSYSSAGISDGYIIRTDDLGLIVWSKFYGRANVDVFRSIKLLPDSGYIICGFSNSAGFGGYDGWVVRINKFGDSLWTKFIGTPDWDFFYDVAPTWDGGFVLAGGTYGAGSGDEDMYFVKIDSIGDTLWTRTYGGAKADEAKGIIQMGDSMIAAVGYSCSLGDTLGDSWILKFNQLGDTIWTRTLGQNNFIDKAHGICDVPGMNRIMVVGENWQTGDPDCYIQANSYSGGMLFNLIFGGLGSDDYYTSVVARANGTIAAIGNTENPLGFGNGDFYFFHDRNGGYFTTSFGGIGTPDAAFSIDLAKDDGYITCGFTESFNSYIPNVLLVKLDTNGLTTNIVGIRENPNNSLVSNSIAFPNPSNINTTIHLISGKPINGLLSLELFDLTGKMIELNDVKWQYPNSNSAECLISTKNFENGLYHYVIYHESGMMSLGKFLIIH